jgi:hypothetical protein
VLALAASTRESGSVRAQASPPNLRAESAPGSGLRVDLITLGPGELVWERFGHNALRISHPATGTDVAYNWGMFSFDEPGFLGRLLKGTMMYWMAPFDTEAMIAAYMADDRSVWIQELALTAAQKAELSELLAVNALPENRFYRYDYYRDNCSTRVRDALDQVLGGRLRAALAGRPTGTTYRSHTRRLLQDMPSMYTGIQLVLSGRADREIDRWEEAFLPVALMGAVRDLQVVDETGVERPLVLSEREVYRSASVTEPTAVPRAWPWYLAIGGALSLVLIGLSGADTRGARVTLALLAVAWSAAAGLGGAVLTGAWLFTDHVFWYPNWNLLQLSPLSLPLAVLLLPLLLHPKLSRAARALGVVIGALSLLGLLAHFAPGVAQRNGEILALTVPINVALALALLRLRAGEARARG